MAKYHVNPETGNPGKCSAKIVCPFGGEENHFKSTTLARRAYELYHEEGRDSIRKSTWADVEAKIPHLDPGLSLYDQLAFLGFERGSEGAKTALAWRKFWLGTLTSEDLSLFKNRTLDGTTNSRIGGTALLLTIMANCPDQNPPHCEFSGCNKGYYPGADDGSELQVDHRESWAETKDNTLKNLQVLCSFHHGMQDTGSKSDLYKFRSSLSSAISDDSDQLSLFDL